MWSSQGAVSDVATATTMGDVGIALGALTMAGVHIGEEYPANTTISSSTITYSIYKNREEVLNSSRTINLSLSIVSLQAMVCVTAREPIEIRRKVDTGEASLDHRILSLIPSEYL